MIHATTGRTINDKVRECGVVALVDLRGDRIWFYPVGRLPNYVVAYLSLHGHSRLLRDFLVTLGRGIIADP